MVPLELVLCDNLMLVITEFNLGPRSPGTSLFKLKFCLGPGSHSAPIPPRSKNHVQPVPGPFTEVWYHLFP